MKHNMLDNVERLDQSILVLAAFFFCFPEAIEKSIAALDNVLLLITFLCMKVSVQLLVFWVVCYLSLPIP